MRYRKKPVEVEAIRLQGAMSADDLAVFMDEQPFEFDEYGVDIPTLEGVMHASPGDWIIRGVKGEFYPCRSDIFEATYELVS